MSLVVVLSETLGLPVGFPLVAFLNGILYRLVLRKIFIGIFIVAFFRMWYAMIDFSR